MPRSCLLYWSSSIPASSARALEPRRRSANTDNQKDLRRLWMQTQISLIHRWGLPEMGTDMGKKGRRRRYVIFSLSFLKEEEPCKVCRVSAATLLLVKLFFSSSKSLRFSSRFIFSSWCARFSISNLSCSSLSSFSSASAPLLCWQTSVSSAPPWVIAH